MIASLPMYDRPELVAETDRYWAAIRAAAGTESPAKLDRRADLWAVWTAPDLFLSQTCGLPYRSRLHGKVRLVATPDYGLEGCPPGFYRSVIVVRADDPAHVVADLHHKRMAINDEMSQSGWAGPVHHMRQARAAPGTTIITGGHAASALAVAEGKADFAGIDALTWEFLCRFDTATERLRVLDATDPTPALPYITSLAQDADALGDAVASAIDSLSDADRRALHIQGVVRIPSRTYLAVPTPPNQ